MKIFLRISKYFKSIRTKTNIINKGIKNLLNLSLIILPFTLVNYNLTYPRVVLNINNWNIDGMIFFP